MRHPPQRMSGIATATSDMAAACQGTAARILETRKTAPCLRVLDKWAVLIGGGVNHRIGLYDMMMIKDNHIAAAGGLRQAVAAAHRRAAASSRRIEIEVEARTMDEVELVVECLASGNFPLLTRVMLDNMARRDASMPGALRSSPCRYLVCSSTSSDQVASSIACSAGCKLGCVAGASPVSRSQLTVSPCYSGGVDISMCVAAIAKIAGRARTEVSGNVTLDTVGAIAKSGCDFISCGALTHSVQALDISYNIDLL